MGSRLRLEKGAEAPEQGAISKTSCRVTVFASIDRFVRLCKDRVDKYARIQTEQSVRLGYWMDWDLTDEDWAKPPGHAQVVLHQCRKRTTTPSGAFLKKCQQRGLVLSRFTTPCRGGPALLGSA